MSPNLHSGRFLIEEAVILEQSWREGKSNVELRVPLENATTVTNPPVGTSSKISSYHWKIKVHPPVIPITHVTIARLELSNATLGAHCVRLSCSCPWCICICISTKAPGWYRWLPRCLCPDCLWWDLHGELASLSLQELQLHQDFLRLPSQPLSWRDLGKHQVKDFCFF